MQLTLFYIPTCPYCRKVLNFLKQNSISLNLKNRDGSKENLNELVKLGGKSHVPCLIVDGKALYESDDIIEWLRTNYRK